MLSTMTRRNTTDSRHRERAEAGKRLAALRERRGLTQSQLAQRVVDLGGEKITQGMIGAMEIGSRGIPNDRRVALARALGVEDRVLDPAATPGLTEVDLTAVASGQPLPARMSAPSTSLPPALEAFLAKNPTLPEPVRWHLVENRQFRLAPWKQQDEAFWAEMAEFWKRYLTEHPPAGGAKSRGAPGKGGG